MNEIDSANIRILQAKESGLYLAKAATIECLDRQIEETRRQIKNLEKSDD